ncbi:MAG: transglycosylase SLT domain-containing protein [Gemmatimonadota bacterium]
MESNRSRRLLVAGVIVAVWAVLVVRAIERGRAVSEEASPLELVLEDMPEATQQPSGPALPTAWDLPAVRNDRVERWIEYLTGERRERMRLWLERSGRYAPMIRAELRRRGMPEDLVYLALIESGFSPRAYSRAHAVGIWQFIASTARRYGLEITAEVDERRDPIRSTEAALDYLEDLYDRFGSWYLAAAAYNTGEGRIERILRRYAGGRRGDDDLYWRISPYIPRETRNYVPLMLAAAHIGKSPEAYGFGDVEYQAPLAFDTVEVPGLTSLRAAARAAEADPARLRDLNPHLVNGTTPPGARWRLRIPNGRAELFAANFERMSREERLAVVRHTVQRGETLSHIARRYGTSVRALRAHNGWVPPRRLQAGAQLRIPVDAPSTLASAEAADDAARWRVHHVRRGDTLWDIARHYDVSVRELQSWNGLGGHSRIIPGQRLRIRG